MSRRFTFRIIFSIWIAIFAVIPGVNAQELTAPGLRGLLLSRIIDSIQFQRSYNIAPVHYWKFAAEAFRTNSILQLDDRVKAQFQNFVERRKGLAGKHLFAGLDTALNTRYMDKELRAMYAFKDSGRWVKQFAIPAQLDNQPRYLGVEVATSDTLGLYKGWWHNISFADDIQIGGVPMLLQFTNLSGHDWMNDGSMNASLIKMSFNKEAYWQKLQRFTHDHFDLQKYYLSDFDYHQYVEEYLNARLENILSSPNFIKQAGALRSLVSKDQLLYMDSVQLQKLILTYYYYDPEKLSSFLEGDAADKDLPGDFLVYETREAYLSALLELKSEIGYGGDIDLAALQLENWRSFQHQRAYDYKNIPSLAKELIPLNGFQRFFLKLNQLTLGNFTMQSGGIWNQAFVAGGFASIDIGKYRFAAALGTRRDVSLSQQMFMGSLKPASFNFQYLQLGIGKQHLNNAKIEVLNTFSKNLERGQFVGRSVNQNVFVGGLNTQIYMGKLGRLNASISKSSSQFNTISNSSKEYANISKAAIGQFFNDFWMTAAVNLNYSGTVKPWGLEQAFHVGYSGLGYNNPGNPYALRGAWQYGLNLKKSILEKRGMIQFRGRLKDMARSVVTGSKWRSWNYSVDGRYKVSRRWFLYGRYVSSSSSSRQDGVNSDVFVNRRGSLASQWQGKWFGKRVSNYSSFGLQQMRYESGWQPVHSEFIKMNTQLSMALKQNFLSISLFYNRDMKQQAVYGNLFTADLGYTYILKPTLQATSGINYLDNKDVVQQAGIKQQVNWQFKSRWAVQASADLRHNFKNSSQNYLYGKFRADLSLYYLLN